MKYGIEIIKKDGKKTRLINIVEHEGVLCFASKCGIGEARLEGGIGPGRDPKWPPNIYGGGEWFVIEKNTSGKS